MLEIYKQLFSFRRSTFYIRFLQVLANIAAYSSQAVCQLCLQWLPYNFQATRTKPALLKKAPAKPKKQEEFVQPALASNEPVCSFANWTRFNSSYNAQNQEHVFAMVCATWCFIILFTLLILGIRCNDCCCRYFKCCYKTNRKVRR